MVMVLKENVLKLDLFLKKTKSDVHKINVKLTAIRPDIEKLYKKHTAVSKMLEHRLKEINELINNVNCYIPIEPISSEPIDETVYTEPNFKNVIPWS